MLYGVKNMMKLIFRVTMNMVFQLNKQPTVVL